MITVILLPVKAASHMTLRVQIIHYTQYRQIRSPLTYITGLRSSDSLKLKSRPKINSDGHKTLIYRPIFYTSWGIQNLDNIAILFFDINTLITTSYVISIKMTSFRNFTVINSNQLHFEILLNWAFITHKLLNDNTHLESHVDYINIIQLGINLSLFVCRYVLSFCLCVSFYIYTYYIPYAIIYVLYS